MTTVDEKQRHTRRPPEPGAEYPVIAGSQSFETVTEQISSVVLTRRTTAFLVVLLRFGVFLFAAFGMSITWLLTKGVGIFGIEIPVAWGFAITNFVWWIGIGHAGTLISAILLAASAELAEFHQPLCGSDDAVRRGLRRNVPADPSGPSVAVLLAAALSEHDDHSAAVPEPFVWDVFAVSTYATVSLLFWYLGIVPDLASIRDRSKSRLKYACLRRARAGLAGRVEALEVP